MRKVLSRLLILFALFGAGAALANPRILVVGDSLTAGLGVSAEAAYPTLLQKKLRSSGMKDAVVVNAGTSGATTAFGVKTMRFHLKRARPDLVIYALGANDALRGIEPAVTERNVEEAITLAEKEKLPFILAGMKAPPNYGAKFPKEFEAIYPRLAKKHKLPFLPFLLEGVAGEPAFNQPDGIHPNEKGHEVMAETVFRAVKEYYDGHGASSRTR